MGRARRLVAQQIPVRASVKQPLVGRPAPFSDGERNGAVRKVPPDGRDQGDQPVIRPVSILAALQDEGPEIQRVACLAAGQYLLLRQAIAVRRLVGPTQAAIEAVVAAIACKFNDAPEKDLRSEPSDGSLPSKRHRRIGAVLPMHQQKRPLLRGQAMRPLQRLQQLFALHISHSFA